MARQSKKKLVTDLKELGFKNSKGEDFQEFNHGISYEAYGRDVQAYISFASQEDRHRAERLLKQRGWPVNTDYWPSSARAEVGVSYFKAWHSDE